MKKIAIYTILAGILISLGACSNKKRKPSIVFMPDMYYPVAYDPYMQANFGYPDNSEESGVPLFASRANSTALWPAEGTVPRTDGDILPWELLNNNEGYAKSKGITTSQLNPEDKVTDLERGKILYGQNCAVCHGTAGDGQGSIVQSKAYSGVPTYAERDITVGSVYHVIMYGRATMGSYASQLTPADRWRVAEYVIQLRNEAKGATAAATTAPAATAAEAPVSDSATTADN